MHLRRLEIHGFKTFAHKTVLEFVADDGGGRGVTAVVGPNGSGKSNIADAFRWVMGEQNMRLLRGKKSEDVIFSGTSKRPRAGFAEVRMTVERGEEAGGMGMEPAEVEITRRLYRDGTSEYEVNRRPVRLQDVALLLAQWGIAQRSYSVIGQGMIDQVLTATQMERKVFFDEAFGVRSFQLKREEAVRKIEVARENLALAEASLSELGPRLTLLTRQVRRLEERDQVETELRELERQYYGHGWREIAAGLACVQDSLKKAKADLAWREAAAQSVEAQMRALEVATPVRDGFKELRDALDKLVAERAALRERELKLETERVVAAVRAEKPWAPLPLSKIIELVQSWLGAHEVLEQEIGKPVVDMASLRQAVDRLRRLGLDLLSKLQRPAPEPEALLSESDPELEREAVEIRSATEQVTSRLVEAEARLEAWSREEQSSRQHIFAVQHDLNRRRQEAQRAERAVTEVSVELARVETRREAFLQEVQKYVPGLELEAVDGLPTPDALACIQRLRAKLEWIGGIDPETTKEYEETKERFEFLTKQVTDVRETSASLEEVVRELDVMIRQRGEQALADLDREFGVAFKKLFGGGEASLQEVGQPEGGIEIQATPPGKRNKAIALLSGGERALTSIALICAIMATNPSPFVVLDEVDAALDEANSRKFAEMLSDISQRTQCLVVTHNRATMHEANVLYGVTMGEDGVSQLLSMKLENQ